LLRIADIQWTPDCGTSESIAAENQPIVATTAGATSAAASTCTRVANGRTEYVYLDGLPIALLRYAAGSTTYFSPSMSRDGNLVVNARSENDAEASSIRWNNLLPNAVIELWGCRNGMDQNSIAAAIARASGRRVIGTTGYVNFDDNGFPFVRFFRDPFGSGFREFTP
jgi:hypothetical protein